MFCRYNDPLGGFDEGVVQGMMFVRGEVFAKMRCGRFLAVGVKRNRVKNFTANCFSSMFSR